MPPKRHLDYLDGLRALAALTVVICHATGQVLWPDQAHGLGHDIMKVGAWLRNIGHYCVDVFIVLSGFCLTYQVIKNNGVLRGGVTGFFIRRGWRIIPPYYGSVLLSMLLIRTLIGEKTGTHWDVSLPMTWRGIWSHALLMQDFFHENATINHALWSISVEWRIYFFFPLLLLFWRKLGITLCLLATIVLSLLLFFFVDGLSGLDLSSHYLGLFGMGMFACVIAFSQGQESLRKLPWGYLAVVLAVITGVLSNIIRFNVHVPVYVDDYIVGAATLAFLITTSLHRDAWHHRLLSWRPLAFTGVFSYSIYLIHAPLLQVLWQYPFRSLQNSPWGMFLALTFIGGPLIVAASWLFFLVCERPFINVRKLKDLTGAPAPAASATPAA